MAVSQKLETPEIFIINGDLIREYLGNDVVSIPGSITVNKASPTRENSGNSHLIIYFTNYAFEAVSWHVKRHIRTVLTDRFKFT